MNDDHRRILGALEKLGLEGELTPYGEVSFACPSGPTERGAWDAPHWLAKTWNDYCRCLGSMSEQGLLSPRFDR